MHHRQNTARNNSHTVTIAVGLLQSRYRSHAIAAEIGSRNKLQETRSYIVYKIQHSTASS